MERNYIRLYSAVLSLFVLLICMLCWYFRISTDDYFYLHKTETESIYRIVSSSYYKWSGRYATFSIQSLLFKILNTRIHYFFLFPLLSFFILAIGLYKNIHQLTRSFNLKINTLSTIVLSLSLLALFFFLSFDIGETWFWCSGMACYLFSIIAVVWGTYFIIQPKGSFFYYPLIAGCFVFTGGSCEVYAPVFLAILAGIILTVYWKHSSASDFFQYSLHKKIITAFLFLQIAYVFFLIAPGNYNRNQLFPEHRFFFSFYVTAKSLVKFFIIFIPSHLHYILAFSTVFYVTGLHLRLQNTYKFKLRFSEFLKKSSLFFILFICAYFYMIAYIMSETGPARIWFLVSVLFSIFCCSIGFYAGYQQVLSVTRTSVLKKLSIAAAFLILCFSIVRQNRIAGRYSKAYDEREHFLTELNTELTKDSIVTVPALQPSGMLYGAEITSDTGHYTNQHLRMWYKLKFHVIKN